MSTPSPAQVRAVHGVLEPYHAVLYFSPRVQERLAGLGLDPRTDGYFALRSAPFGVVPHEVVRATFFVFSPRLVGAMVGRAWSATSPDAVMAARHEGIAATLRDAGVPDDTVAELTELAGLATEDLELGGRPLAAANAAVPLPDDPQAALFQRLTVLREHRGDGHLTALVSRGLRPLEALVLMAAWPGGGVSRRFLQTTRAWDDEAWDEATDDLRAVGLLDADGDLTGDGLSFREAVEHDTDVLATEPYARLGTERTRRFFELLRPHATAVAGVFPRPATVAETFPDA